MYRVKTNVSLQKERYNMKVLIFGMSQLHGGIESFLHAYVMNSDQDIQFDFVKIEDEIPFEKDFEKRGSTIFKVNGRRDGIKQYRESLDTIIIQGKYDVVWSNLCTLSDIEILKIAKKNGVRKRIIHSHNGENMGNILTKVMHKVNSKKLKSIVTDFWACSQLAGEWMFDGIIDKSEIVLINNAIDAKQYIYNPFIRAEVRESLEIFPSTFVVGHVGRLHFQKNQKYLIDIFNEIQKLHPDSILVMVGSGELKQELEVQIKKLYIEDKVMFLGQRKDVVRLLQAFDNFVLPSVFEGLPVVLVESQAAGLETFVSTAVSEHSKISPLVEFLSLEEDPKLWAERILAKKDNRRKNTYKDIVLANYDIENEASRLKKLFSE